MKAVVMAGGEGTRLRPLTSNQPKPMVSIVGKPCIEHILELLGRHGFDEVIVTLAFLPQAIRSYFGDGESLGLEIEYSVEEVPMGTAGSVRLASRRLDEPFLVISGDALCDFDLTALVAFHRERGAAATIGLKSVDNPLEYGIVVADEDGRIERFLEKPSWGQVFSDTINTGVYVLDSEVLRHVPDDRPYDFSKELFPLLLEMGRPLYGYVCGGYWQDIGNLAQYHQANFDVLDAKTQLRIDGMRLRGNIWVGEDVDLDVLDGVEGPAYIGNSCRVSPRATVGPHTVLGAGVTVRSQARVTRSVVDAATYVGRSAVIDGALVGRSCEIRSHVHVHERAAIGDEVVLGDQCLVSPGVRIYPFKEIESGAQIHESVIWEARSASHLFGKTGVSGLVNVDLTPETALRLAAALGTALRRGARVVASRESSNGCRMIEWAMISGLLSTGVHVADLRVMPAPIGRHLLRTRGYDAGFHVGLSRIDPESVEIRFFEQPGIQLTQEMEKEIEKHFTRHELRRVAVEDVAEPNYPAGVTELYAQDLLWSLDVDAIRARSFRVAVDHGESAASFVLPLLTDPLGVEVVSTSGGASDGMVDAAALHESIGRVKRLVQAAGADLGAVFDRAAERLYLVDERGQQIPVDRTLLLFLRLVGSNGRKGRIAVPVSVTGEAERIAAEGGLEVLRTPSSSAELTRAAAEDGIVFAGAIGGAYVFPEFLPAYDAVASLCKLLELLAPARRPLSELVAAVPQPRVRHRQLHCPWALKGLVMRVLAERLKHHELEVVDGIKMLDDRGWAQVIPDSDEPILHVYAEGHSDEETGSLSEELRSLVERIMTEEEIGAEAQISS